MYALTSIQYGGQDAENDPMKHWGTKHWGIAYE